MTENRQKNTVVQVSKRRELLPFENLSTTNMNLSGNLYGHNDEFIYSLKTYRPSKIILSNTRKTW